MASYNKGDNNPAWKGGIKKKKDYNFRYKPDHPRATKENPHVGRHVLAMEEYLSIIFDENVYIPKGWHVHHIKPIKEGGSDALINLELVTNAQHKRLHQFDKHQDTSDRVCFRCGSDKTRLKTPWGINRTPHLDWHHLPYDKANWYCYNCYMAYIRHKHKQT